MHRIGGKWRGLPGAILGFSAALVLHTLLIHDGFEISNGARNGALFSAAAFAAVVSTLGFLQGSAACCAAADIIDATCPDY